MVADLATLPWERWADGRPWRLKDGKHFDGEPKAAVAAAEDAAARMGKAVRTLTDPQPPHRYVWVQFADRELPPGAPCPCGGHTLERLHPAFVRCTQCGETALLVSRKATAQVNLLTSLDAYTDITFFDVRRASDERKESAYGHALDPRGRRMLIVASFPLHAGDRVRDPAKPDREPDDPSGYLHTVRSWSAQPFAHAIDFEALGGTPADDRET